MLQILLLVQFFTSAKSSILSLRDHALLMVAPPCSLFVPISQSVHGRRDALCTNLGSVLFPPQFVFLGPRYLDLGVRLDDR